MSIGAYLEPINQPISNHPPEEPKIHPTQSQIRIHWLLANAIIIAIAIFSVIMYLYSYDIFKYILMFMMVILVTYNIASYYTGNSFSSYTGSYSESSMWFLTIIIILTLMVISSSVIRNYKSGDPIVIPDFP